VKKLKVWPVWMLMGVIVVVLLSIGATRDSGPLTQSERIDEITQRIACPTCNGESVYVSRAAAAEAIRKQVARDVGAGVMSDDQIVGSIANTFQSKVLLLPRATGIDSLVWILPIAALVCSLAGLGAVFRRWKKQNANVASPEDVAMVEKLLIEDVTDADFN